MSKEVIKVDGTVIECLKGGKFRVKLDSGIEVIAYPSGNIRRKFVRILTGDRVMLELTPYDLTQGRIIYRQK